MSEIYSDEMLIHQCRLGDQAALDNIMNKYKPLVIKNSRSMFLIGGETEDLIQEGMIGLFKAVDGTTAENVTVTTEAVNSNVAGVYTANSSDWTKGTRDGMINKTR